MLDKKGVEFTPDPLLGNGSLNVGTIEGGTGINIVPDECVFKIDGRLVPGQTYDGVIGAIRDMISELKAQDPTFDAEVDFCARTSNAVHISEDSPLVKALLENSKLATGKEADLSGFIAQGDNYFFNKNGIPAIMFGPGTLDCIHKANEWVKIDDLVEAAKIYALTALSVC